MDEKLMGLISLNIELIKFIEANNNCYFDNQYRKFYRTVFDEYNIDIGMKEVCDMVVRYFDSVGKYICTLPVRKADGLFFLTSYYYESKYDSIKKWGIGIDKTREDSLLNGLVRILEEEEAKYFKSFKCVKLREVKLT